MATSCFSNFSVLVQVNSGMLDMWCNWWTHYKKLKLENPVYVVAHGDDAIAALVNEYGLPPERLLAPPRMGAAGESGQLVGAASVRNFGSASFYAFNTAKIRAARDLMAQTGRPVVFTDLDTAWLKSPLEQLARLPSSKAFAIGPEGSHLDFAPKASTSAAAPPPPATNKHYVCACFFAACPSYSGVTMLDKWWTASGGADGRANEQLAFQWLLNLWPELIKGRTRNAGAASPPRLSAASAAATLPTAARAVAARFSGDDAWLDELLANSSGFGAEGDDGPVAILPHYAFPTGRHDPPVTAHSVWVHANWIQRKTRASTTMAKRNRLAKHGLWSHSCEREVNRTT